VRAWKRQRLIELGYGVADGLRLVPDDFETDGSWWAKLAAAGFDAARPAVVASLGVSMYLTREANQATLRQLAALAPGSTVVMTFQPPLALLEAAERTGRSFAEVRHVSAAELNKRYFGGRTDGLHTTCGEELLVAVTGPGRGR
jgi:O-methyltransferase involved in polyketide biosynthesis